MGLGLGLEVRVTVWARVRVSRHLAASRVAVDDAPLKLLADALAAALPPAHLVRVRGRGECKW